MNRIRLIASVAAVSAAVLFAGAPASAMQHSTSPPETGRMTGPGMTGQGMTGQGMMGQGMMGQGMLMMPSMDPARGRRLFASKGCVVCHSVNGIGGEHAPPLDASTMRPMMNPFEFAAKMWRGAEAMIHLQREELGEQIAFTGQELADIVAFTHHPEEQKRFSEADIPHRIMHLMHHLGEEEHHEDEGAHGADQPRQ